VVIAEEAEVGEPGGKHIMILDTKLYGRGIKETN